MEFADFWSGLDLCAGVAGGLCIVALVLARQSHVRARRRRSVNPFGGLPLEAERQFFGIQPPRPWPRPTSKEQGQRDRDDELWREWKRDIWEMDLDELAEKWHGRVPKDPRKELVKLMARHEGDRDSVWISRTSVDWGRFAGLAS